MTKIKVGLQTFGVIRLFVKDKTIRVKGNKFEVTDYWTNISKKNDEKDVWINKSFPVKFGREAKKPLESGLIDVLDAWFFLSGNEGYEKITLFINEWVEVDD